MSKLRYNPTNLLALIDAANTTIEQTAINVGISCQSLNKYCRGYSTPGTSALVSLADYFAVPVDFLLGRCTPEEEANLLRHYRESFNLLRRAPWEAYLRTKKQTGAIAEGYDAPWPYNLLDEIGLDAWPDVLTEDQELGLNQALDMLPEREQTFVRMYYQRGKSLKEIARLANLSNERARQIVARGVRKLRHPAIFNLVRYGAEGVARKNAINSRMEELAEAEKQIESIEGRLLHRAAEMADAASQKEKDNPADMPIEGMWLTTRTHNALVRSGARTVRDVADRLKHGNILAIRNLGRKGLDEILVKIQMITGEDYRDLYCGGDNNAAV